MMQDRSARRAVKYAISTGKLKRPAVCESCGNVPKKILEGHHEDYSKPLEVMWLCISCHKGLHARKRREASAKARDIRMVALLERLREKHLKEIDDEIREIKKRLETA